MACLCLGIRASQFSAPITIADSYCFFELLISQGCVIHIPEQAIEIRKSYGMVNFADRL